MWPRRYGRYQVRRAARARREFRELLQETRQITHTTLNDVEDATMGETHTRELIAALSRDSRCVCGPCRHVIVLTLFLLIPVI